MMPGTQEALLKYPINKYNPNKCLLNAYNVPGTVLDACKYRNEEDRQCSGSCGTFILEGAAGEEQ